MYQPGNETSGIVAEMHNLSSTLIVLTVLVELWAGGDISPSIEDFVGLTNPVFTIKIAMVILISE